MYASNLTCTRVLPLPLHPTMAVLLVLWVLPHSAIAEEVDCFQQCVEKALPLCDELRDALTESNVSQCAIVARRLRKTVQGDPEYWTCSMHPSVREGSDGDCHICGLSLYPVERQSHGLMGSHIDLIVVTSQSLEASQDVETSRYLFDILSRAIVGALFLYGHQLDSHPAILVCGATRRVVIAKDSQAVMCPYHEVPTDDLIAVGFVPRYKWNKR